MISKSVFFCHRTVQLVAAFVVLFACSGSSIGSPAADYDDSTENYTSIVGMENSKFIHSLNNWRIKWSLIVVRWWNTYMILITRSWIIHRVHIRCSSCSSLLMLYVVEPWKAWLMLLESKQTTKADSVLCTSRCVHFYVIFLISGWPSNDVVTDD